MGLFNFGNKKNESVIGVDIGASSIKIVQLRKRKGIAVLETYGELSLSSYANSEIGQATNLPSSTIAQALKDLLKEANITTKNAGVSIPFSSSLISIIQMPALDKKKLAVMIPIEARKYIPVPISEVSFDWFIIPNEERITASFEDKEKKDKTENPPDSGEENESIVVKEKVDVLLVAIHNNTLNKYNEIVQNAGLDVSFFEIEIFSAIRAVIEQSITPVMVLDMGSANTKLYIVEYGVVKSSHVINSGGQNLTQNLSKSLSMSTTKAEEFKRKLDINENKNNSSEVVDPKDIILLGLNRIFTEANKALSQYQQKYNKNIGKVILTGGGSTLKGILDIAKAQLETEVILSDPFSKVETPAFFEKVLKEVGPEFAVAIGLALRKLQEE